MGRGQEPSGSQTPPRDTGWHAGDLHRRAPLKRHLHQRGVREIADRLAVGAKKNGVRAPLRPRYLPDLHGLQAAEIQLRRRRRPAASRRRRSTPRRAPSPCRRVTAAGHRAAPCSDGAPCAEDRRRCCGRTTTPQPPQPSSSATPAASGIPRRDRARHECPRRLHGGRTGRSTRARRTRSRGALPSALAVLRQALADDAVERRRRERRRHGHRRRVALEDRPDDARLAAALEGAPAGHHLVEHGAEREDVAARIDVAPLELLGRHVEQRAEDRARPGQRRRSRSRGTGAAAGAAPAP